MNSLSGPVLTLNLPIYKILQVQDKTIWLKKSEDVLVEAGSNPSLESL
jgi:hypothetical protein